MAMAVPRHGRWVDRAWCRGCCRRTCYDCCLYGDGLDDRAVDDRARRAKNERRQKTEEEQTGCAHLCGVLAV